MPTSTRPARPPLRPRSALGATILLVLAMAVAAGCSDAKPSGNGSRATGGLIVLAATDEATSLLGWDGSSPDGIPITLPKSGATWIATGRSDVLAAVLPKGTTATSDPVHLGQPLAWRPVKASDPTGKAPAGPDFFATWDPEGGRFATLAGDLPSAGAMRIVLIDPSVSSAFEIAIDQAVVAAPPVWIDADRLVLVTGDAAAPLATIVDTTTGGSEEGPSGSRLLAASADGKRIATMDGQGDPVVVRATTGWLAGDGSSIASITPPTGSATAIGFALDSTGQRLVVAWAADDGTVSLAVHDGSSDWRRVAQPAIGAARGAVVAWRR
jgi:hypothetical protein